MTIEILDREIYIIYGPKLQLDGIHEKLLEIVVF